jgi:prolyl oligopeptidase
VNFFSKLFFHKLGTPQSDDQLIYENRDIKEWTFVPEVSEDGRYLIIFIWKGSDGTNQIYYKDLQQPNAKVVELIKGFDAAYNFVGNDHGRFWFRTDAGAPMGRVVEVDIAQPDRAKWQNVIAEGSDALQGASLVGDRLFASYLKDASSQIRVFDLKGAPVREVALPGLGSAGGFNGRRADTETFYAFLSFIQPPTIYRYDVRSGESTVFKQPQLKFTAADFETQRVFVTSKDGTRLPMFVTHRRGMKLDGNNPTIMYGYGAFRISLTPRFSPETVAFLEQGGVYAQPSLRGGFEYGEAWHQGGMFERKQNVFDDFIASAEWLIANKYTQPSKLAIRGGSNGGLLVGAVLTQRPELFGAALPAVGVMDMLRFQHFSINWTLTAEYGSSDNPEQFRYLRAYSPLHNIRPGTKYPPTLITAGDHDDRLPPIHSYKFAATMQHDQAGDAPVLIRIDTRTGHGMGRPVTKEIDLAADSLAFIHQALGMN